MKETTLTIVLLLYGADGSVTAEPRQDLAFTSAESCANLRLALAQQNARNPFPLPADADPKTYRFPRWQFGDCIEEAENKEEEKPAP